MSSSAAIRRPGRGPLARSLSRRRTAVAVAVGVSAVGLAALLFWLGWYSAGRAHQHQVDVGRTFVGRITYESSTREAGCVTPDGESKPLCSEFLGDPSRPPRMGQHVRVAELMEHGAGGDVLHALVIYTV